MNALVSVETLYFSMLEATFRNLHDLLKELLKKASTHVLNVLCTF